MRDDTFHIRDPIHGAIRISTRELDIVESATFQRLRGIRQLGFADHAFPGATHTRFAHSLGAMEMASKVFDSVFPPESGILPSQDRQRLRQLVRLALLLHDVGHAPFSHATESCMPLRSALKLDCFLPEHQLEQASHEDFTIKLLLEGELNDLFRRGFCDVGIQPIDICTLIAGAHLRQDLRRTETFRVNGIDYQPLLSNIVSGELDADRMDYLPRDSFYAGVNYGKYDEPWLVSNLTHHVENDRAYLALLHRAIFAFEDFLLSRHHMFVSVYYHHTSIGFDTMLSRYLDEARHEIVVPVDAANYIQWDDIAFWSDLRRSMNPWAQRIVKRKLYRRVFELNTEKTAFDLAGLREVLLREGIEFFINSDESVLSRYYNKGQGPVPIYVINREIKQAVPIDSYSKVFERYAQPTRLTRLYCRPDQVERVRAILPAFVPHHLQLGLPIVEESRGA